MGGFKYEPKVSQTLNAKPIDVPTRAPREFVAENKHARKKRPRIGPLNAPGSPALSWKRLEPVRVNNKAKLVLRTPQTTTMSFVV